MTRPTFRQTFLGLAVAPLALGLAACGESASTDGEAVGDPIENIAPPEGSKWSEVIVTTDEGGYRMGNPDAPIKVIEYGSLTCPHCAHFSEESGEELKGQFVESGRVSFEFRNFVMNPLDLTMAMMVRCGAPESFFALTEQTFANQAKIVETWTSSSEAQMTAAASQGPQGRYIAFAQLGGLSEFYAARGIAVDQANTCLANSDVAESLVKATSEQSDKYKITGTPAFLVNGKLAEGNTWPEIKTVLENLGAR